MKKTNRILTIVMFIFLYIPMIVLVVASFNTGKDITNFEGFTLNRYVELFQDEHLLNLLRNSIVVSVLSTFVATTFGTVAVIGIHNLKPKMRKVVMSLTNIPMTILISSPVSACHCFSSLWAPKCWASGTL